ncbi:MAG: hypothetical protein IIB60_00850 [Planctomycetes bacterium]|nr:hypothetical protein [Planctomycetota bacterium]MCH8967392.1 hypothetical protein [Planctomycetota bacterium]
MTIAQLRKALRTQPFKPFTICMTDGRQFRVPHPDCVAVTPNARRTFVVAGAGEDYRIVDLLLVTSIDSTNTRRRGTRTTGR